MFTLSLIVAHSEDSAIGHADGRLPWHLPDELRWFKATTRNRVVVMGRKTAMAIGRPLPHRYNVVLSRDEPGTRDALHARGFFRTHSSAGRVITSLDALWDIPRDVYDQYEQEVVICGGAEVYRQAMEFDLPRVERIYRTIVHTRFDHDDTLVRFDLDPYVKGWHTSELSTHSVDDAHEHAFTIRSHYRY
jgi:dihydrofolate reductase